MREDKKIKVNHLALLTILCLSLHCKKCKSVTMNQMVQNHELKYTTPAPMV